MPSANDNLAILESMPASWYLQGDAVGERYACDWSGGVPFKPPVVLRPSSTEEVALMLKVCHAVSQPLVIQGGLTGLSGGAIPQSNEWSLSLERLRQSPEIDPIGQTLKAGAGVTLQTMHEQAAQHDLRLPLDLGARGSCMVGGLVSTNAGGNQVVQFGMTRALLLGLTVVLADGTVVRSDNQLLKNNAGYDLKQLFIGSEGTLGVVTEAIFRLFPDKPNKSSAFCGLNSFSNVVDLLTHLNRRLSGLSAFEVMWNRFYKESIDITKVSPPLGYEHEFYVLVESEGVDIEATELEFQQALMEVIDNQTVEDAAIANSQANRQLFWSIRDGIAELLGEFAPAANFDIGIPIPTMAEFSEQLQFRLDTRYPGHRTLIFGHVADGNLHVLSTTGEAEDVYEIYDLTYQLTGEFGGTITAEHGVGVAKKSWLKQSRSESEIALMRTLKETMDPRGILNPGRIF